MSFLSLTQSRSFFDLPLDIKMEKMMDESAIGYDGGKKFNSYVFLSLTHSSRGLAYGGDGGQKDSLLRKLFSSEHQPEEF